MLAAVAEPAPVRGRKSYRVGNPPRLNNWAFLVWGAAVPEYLNADDVASLITSEALYGIIDVRDWGDFTRGQIPGACALPRGHLEKYLQVLIPSQDAWVVFYCDTGTSSTLAAMTAEEMGYTGISVLKDGLAAWISAGYQVMKGWSLRGKAYAEHLQASEGIPNLTVEQLRQRLAAGHDLRIVDTRMDSEFLASHLPGAHAVPLGELPFLVSEYPRDEVPLVANCAGRARGILGAYLLRRMGFSHVYALTGGTAAWRLAGHGSELRSGAPTERPKPTEAGRARSEAFAKRLVAEEGIRSITPRELNARQLAGELVYVLDVRELSEYRSGRPLGALFCPGTQLILLAESLVGVKNAPVVTVCDGLVRSSVAATFLKGMGYPDVYRLEGGIQGWRHAGLPFEKGPPHELDYGGPTWLARIQLGVTADTEMVPLPVFGLELAREKAKFVAPDVLYREMTNVQLLDLRSAGDFALGHLPGSRWRSRGGLDIEIENLVPDQSVALVLYCSDGRLSALSATDISARGYTNVRILDGGFLAWQRARLPVQEGVGFQPEIEALAITEIGVMAGSGPYRCNNELLAQYLKEGEEFADKVSGSACLHAGISASVGKSVPTFRDRSRH